MTATKQNFFKPTKASAAKKVADTLSVSRGIVEQEAALREKKTERLRALRLAEEAANPVQASAKSAKNKA